MDWTASWQQLVHWAQGLGVFALLVWASHSLWLPHLKELLSDWIDRRFKKKLQEADHAFQEKVRHVQSQIDRELDRARKLQDREFEALTEGWAIVHEAYWRARDATRAGAGPRSVRLHPDRLPPLAGADHPEHARGS